jgi:hypothetical protein
MVEMMADTEEICWAVWTAQRRDEYLLVVRMVGKMAVWTVLCMVDEKAVQSASDAVDNWDDAWVYLMDLAGVDE